MPDPRTGHECGDSRYLAIPFFDFWLEHRLPKQAATNQRALRPVQEALAQWKTRMVPLVEEYQREGSTGDTTPPSAPSHVVAKRQSDGTVIVTWEAEADFESGIGGFEIERDDKVIAKLPENPVGRFGRPLFQTMSYHDTPEQPLPEMKFVDREAPQGKLPTYRVRTINSVGLKSAPASNR